MNEFPDFDAEEFKARAAFDLREAAIARIYAKLDEMFPEEDQDHAAADTADQPASADDAAPAVSDVGCEAVAGEAAAADRDPAARSDRVPDAGRNGGRRVRADVRAGDRRGASRKRPALVASREEFQDPASDAVEIDAGEEQSIPGMRPGREDEIPRSVVGADDLFAQERAAA